ncbi:trypsin-like serine protease [Staphylococcus agnetis]|nr:trypsin-like serine protease [Staphylococcus agnetis]MCO4339730.1 trypsin-like serine protease [Staphylococcus agnetis]MCO4349217.1 trypsin-like serine protease [Staphylococcus agnetis]MCO4361047.1 trypsin-like serine protease [Staphylococcus agnetis]MCO4372736.1 trypsin-like serine protease [Staphylococcus agnetis]
MYKKLESTALITTLFINSTPANAQEDADNRHRVVDTFEGRSLFTAKLERDKGICTAVLLDKNKAVTAAHCINNTEGSVGTLYPAQSSELSLYL